MLHQTNTAMHRPQELLARSEAIYQELTLLMLFVLC